MENEQPGTEVTVEDDSSISYTDFIFLNWNTESDGSGTDYDSGDTLTLSADVTLYAKWAPEYCTVTFDSQGGSDVDLITGVPYNTKITEPDEPTRSGYTFEGWYTDLAYTTAWDFDSDTVTDHMTLYAKWTSSGGVAVPYYTLSFETNGGSDINSVTRAYGVTVSLDAYVPTRDGFTFTGWYSDSDLTDAVTSVNLTRNMTVYAGWEADDDDSDADYSDDLNMVDHFAYVYGYPNGTVRPEGNITRAETATIIYRLLTAECRDEIFATSNAFSDVTADLWYNKAVSSLAGGGYINGYEDGTFLGDEAITRAEFVAILARFIGVDDSTAAFTDLAADYWAYEYISTAVNTGWIEGYVNGSFMPEQHITRAEAMTIINRVLDRGIDEDSEIPDGIVQWPDNGSDAWYYYEVVEATNDHEYTGSRPDEDWTSLTIDYTYDIETYENP